MSFLKPIDYFPINNIDYKNCKNRFDINNFLNIYHINNDIQINEGNFLGDGTRCINRIIFIININYELFLKYNKIRLIFTKE